MAVETGFLNIGFLKSGGDYRDSTITGTSLSGPRGSGQFLLVSVSTTTLTDMTVTMTTAGSTLPILGVLQNKPSTGIAADVKFIGVSKVVMGATGNGSPVVGGRLSPSSVSSGCVGPFSSTAGYVGVALEAPSTAGSIFTAIIYGGFPGVQPA